MRAAVLLDLDEIVFVEPSFERLPDDAYTYAMTLSDATEGRMLINEREDPIALALKEGGTWKVGSLTLRRPTEALFEKLEGIDIEIYQEDQAEWEAAVREYFSTQLAGTVPPAVEDYSRPRSSGLVNVVRSLWRGEKKGPCLDACCGSGMGSVVLRHLGMSPLSFDKDPSLLSLGLRTGRLLPEETMCFDATRVDRYLRRTGHGMILMAGEITPFNTQPWRQIVGQMLSLTEKLIITTGTEKEAALLMEWCSGGGRTARLIKNDSDPFYDRWICDVRS